MQRMVKYALVSYNNTHSILTKLKLYNYTIWSRLLPWKWSWPLLPLTFFSLLSTSIAFHPLEGYSGSWNFVCPHILASLEGISKIWFIFFYVFLLFTAIVLWRKPGPTLLREGVKIILRGGCLNLALLRSKIVTPP